MKVDDIDVLPTIRRPITKLNVISKILERPALKRLRRHMQCSPNTAPQQSVCPALPPTETAAMSRAVSDMLIAGDSKCPTVLLSLDISAVFDTIDHNRLLYANKLVRFDVTVLDWLRSYLSVRVENVIA